MTRLALLTLTFIVACGGADTPADPDPSAARRRTLAEGCNEIFVRQRDCTDPFIPGLVDARIAANVPAGIAERAEAEGRDAIIAEAMAEWAEDSKDQAIAATCERVIQSIPPDQQQEMREAGDACLAESGCEAFVACIIPMIEARFR